MMRFQIDRACDSVQSWLVLRTFALGLLVVLTAGCSVVLPVPSPTAEACPGALAEGRLASDRQGSAMLVMEGNRHQLVQWPDGYSIDAGPPIRLFDPSGQLVAEEGDVVFAGGGFTTGDDLFIACGYVSRDPP